ncbi:MAG: hypothetical protein AB8B78_13830 [Polaribacter sp.]
MKNFFLTFFLISSFMGFTQKKVIKKIETAAKEINIYTAGLDNIILENSETNFLEVTLVAESYDNQIIKLENNKNFVDIKFELEGVEIREVVFRKFITKRLQRATAIVKIPLGKTIIVFGENVDIESKSLKNDLAIYIENGIVKLNKIKANTILKLYSGNVYASIKKTNIDVSSKDGKIKVDTILHQKKYLNKNIEFKKELKITSLRANIFLEKF